MHSSKVKGNRLMKQYLLSSLLVIGLFLIGCSTSSEQPAFVKVKGIHFELNGVPYYFLGTNVWYGCNLASKGEGGDRERLSRELDLLKSIGINNLRIMGASEGNTQPNIVYPAIQPELAVYDDMLLDGLDFLLWEMEKRQMYAVIYLNNYWEWSGGMAQYVSWFEGTDVPNPFYPHYSYDQFMKFSAQFYQHEKANQAFREYVKMLIERKNSYTSEFYRDDPTIMAWQLANEPRPGRGEWGKENFDVFSKWIDETAAYIKSLDPNHLVSTGNEGTAGCMESAELYQEIHRYQNIDYMTAHLWLLNWRWFDPLNAEATYPEAVNKALAYLQKNIEFAQDIGKPLVFEEFGIPRDNHSYSPQASTAYRDRYFTEVFNFIFENSKTGGPLVGSNFWAWGGEGTARETVEAKWQRGDSYTGDPPQEPQGRNSVFVSDSSTISVLSNYTEKMNFLSK
jgi:mannan endo-1,4-beta-mannosidase